VEHDVDLETVQNETTRPATKSALHELDLAQQTTPLAGLISSRPGLASVTIVQIQTGI